MDTTQLLKGVLDAAVLAVVQHDDGYGYDIVRRLREAGLGEVGDARYVAGRSRDLIAPLEGRLGPDASETAGRAGDQPNFTIHVFLRCVFVTTASGLLTGRPFGYHA